MEGPLEVEGRRKHGDQKRRYGVAVNDELAASGPYNRTATTFRRSFNLELNLLSAPLGSCSSCCPASPHISRSARRNRISTTRLEYTLDDQATQAPPLPPSTSTPLKSKEPMHLHSRTSPPLADV